MSLAGSELPASSVNVSISNSDGETTQVDGYISGDEKTEDETTEGRKSTS